MLSRNKRKRMVKAVGRAGGCAIWTTHPVIREKFVDGLLSTGEGRVN